MADEAKRFQTTGESWSERAKLGGLQAVLSPTGSPRRNLFLHGANLFGAKQALRLGSEGMRLVDFGCGTGRFVRFFGERGCAVLGTEITPSMIAEAEAEGIPAGCRLCLTDGTSIPTPDASVDMIWCCAVLRYSLLVADPVYDRIAVEMFRALRPGGWVVNVEIYVEQPPGTFLMDFERAGFVTREVRILQRHGGRLERLLSHRLWPLACIPWTARLCARLRYRLDRPDRSVPGLRDYVFVWQKPPCEG